MKLSVALLLSATAVTAVAAKPLPPRFDIVCTGEPLRTATSETVLAAPRSLRTVDTTRKLWCEGMCTSILSYRDAPGRLDLYDRVDRVGPGSTHMHLALGSMVMETVITSASGTTRNREICKIRPFSGLKQRPPPY